MVAVTTVRPLSVHPIRGEYAICSRILCPDRLTGHSIGRGIRDRIAHSTMVSYELMFLEIVICVVEDDVRVSPTEAERVY